MSLFFKFFTNPYRLKAQYLMGLSRLKPKVNWPEELKAQKREGSKAKSSKRRRLKTQSSKLKAQSSALLSKCKKFPRGKKMHTLFFSIVWHFQFSFFHISFYFLLTYHYVNNFDGLLILYIRYKCTKKFFRYEEERERERRRR